MPQRKRQLLQQVLRYHKGRIVYDHVYYGEVENFYIIKYILWEDRELYIVIYMGS